MASELKIASAFFFDRRSPISSSFASGRPRSTPLSRTRARPNVVVGALAAAFAVSCPGPEYRKYAVWGRSTRIRLSPGFRPEMGRRPPIIGSQPVGQPGDEALGKLEPSHGGLDGSDVEGRPAPGGGPGV